MNTIISKNGHDYRMSIIFDKTTQTYYLVFSSTRDNHGEQYACSCYSDAVKRFEQNCLFYGVRELPYMLTEEEFLGIKPGQVWPQSEQPHNTEGGKKCHA